MLVFANEHDLENVIDEGERTTFIGFYRHSRSGVVRSVILWVIQFWRSVRHRIGESAQFLFIRTRSLLALTYT